MSVQSVDRAMAILNSFSVDEPRLGVTDLSRKLGLHKSTVHRLLVALRQAGVVRQEARSRKYRLGMGLIELGNTTLNSWGASEVVLPYLHYVADTVEEMAYLAVRDGHEIVNVVQIPGPHLVQSVAWTGRAPLHCTSAGKVFLAHMPKNEREALLAKGLPRMTAKTITDVTELRAELDRVRDQGFATALEERAEGINALAVPLTGSDHKVIAAIGVTGPSYRFTPEEVMRFPHVMRSVAREVSQTIADLPETALVIQ